LDAVPRNYGFEKTGCEELIKEVIKLAGKNLKTHIFGHIHCGYGTTENFGVKFINASNCDEAYEAKNPPIVFEI
jgi:hypothetical protein